MPPPTKFFGWPLKKASDAMGIWTCVLVFIGWFFIVDIAVEFLLIFINFPLLMLIVFGCIQTIPAIMWLVTLCANSQCPIQGWAVLFLIFRLIGMLVVLVTPLASDIQYGWYWFLIVPFYAAAWIVFDVYAFRCIWQYGVEKSLWAMSIPYQTGMMTPLD